MTKKKRLIKKAREIRKILKCSLPQSIAIAKFLHTPYELQEKIDFSLFQKIYKIIDIPTPSGIIDYHYELTSLGRKIEKI